MLEIAERFETEYLHDVVEQERTGVVSAIESINVAS
jgi:hypothetical protein